MPNLDSLNEDRVELALRKLSSTDDKHAILAGEVKRLEEMLKSTKAKAFLEADGTVAEREAKALSSVEYQLAIEEWISKFKEFKTLDNERHHEIRVVELWQTLSANRRKGNL